MYSKDAEEESTESDYDDKTTHVPGSTVESSKKKELKRKGPITLKVYREDDTSEINPEFKASDLHLGEWREVVTACPNKKGEGWTSIYKKIHERIDYLRTTKAEVGINLDRPLSEQDPLDRLNDLTNKKRKHADDIHDFFRANKRLKSSVQYKDHPASIVLNEHVLASALQVLRRLGSIFTSVYAVVNKLKKDSCSRLKIIRSDLFHLAKLDKTDDKYVEHGKNLIRLDHPIVLLIGPFNKHWEMHITKTATSMILNIWSTKLQKCENRYGLLLLHDHRGHQRRKSCVYEAKGL
nr:hypothetical protein [Tanacetum cinerariifolium]